MMPKHESLELALLSARRLTDVMSRVPVDLEAALQSEDGAALLAAISACQRCKDGKACDAWIATHDDGGGHAVPEFCPNAAFFRSFCRTG